MARKQNAPMPAKLPKAVLAAARGVRANAPNAGDLPSHDRGRRWSLQREFLGEAEEKPFRSADIAEPVRVFVLDDFADELRAAVA